MSDHQIIDGARRALIANPNATMADIARSAGVGMSALYARFASRQVLLQHFGDEGNRLYQAALDQVGERVDAGEPARRVLRLFMAQIMASDIHAVWSAVAGTFRRSAADLAHSIRLRDAGEALVDHCHAAGVLRPGVSWRDLLKAQEMIAAVDGADADRTRELRERMLDVVFTGLTQGRRPLRGEPPRRDDIAENRAPT